jgi:hypothetical protein
LWKGGGTFALDGRRYEVTATFWRTRSTMVDEMGGVVAAAERMGRKRWTVTAGSRTYQFRRGSALGHRQDLYEGEQRVGTIRRTNLWRNDVEADLPGVPIEVQVFVLGVVIAIWDNQRVLASGGGSS